jgi:glutathione S-transferase
LEAANANYKLEQVSLYGPGGKPDWFWELNPKGQVPVLVVDYENEEPVILADSDLILDEIGRVMDDASMLALPGKSMDSTEADKKVQAFRVCLKDFLPIGKQAVLGGKQEKMWAKLRELDALIAGPFVTGEELTIADCAGFPFLWRLDQEYKNNWEENECHKIPNWLKHCSQNPVFSNSVQRSWWWWW